MSNTCKDFYGERLKEKDYVIPMCSEACIIGIEGYISEINFSDNESYITIIDEKGNILIKDVNSSYYSTKERFETYETDKHHYYLTFYSKNAHSLTFLTLTNATDENYEFPEGTVFVKLNDEKVNKKRGVTISGTLLTFISKDVAELSKNGENHYFIINNGHCGVYYTPESSFIADNYQEMECKVRKLIKYFNKYYNFSEIVDPSIERNDWTNPKLKDFENNMKLQLLK